MTRLKYQQLEGHFSAQIASGRLAPGSALPAERRIAADFQVALGTVRQAIAALEQRGLVSRFQGRGTFVCGDARQRLQGGLNVVALIVPDAQYGFHPSLIEGVGTGALAAQRQVMVCTTGNDLRAQGDAILQLIDKQVAGVALVPVSTPETPPYQIRQLQRNGIAAVFCHRRPEGVDAPLVTFSPGEAGRRAGELFLRRGRRRVACFMGHRFRFAEEYERSLRETLPLPAEFVHYGTHTAGPIGAEAEASLISALDRMLSSGRPPEGIFTTWDVEAEVLYLHLEQRGLRPGKDISLITFGPRIRQGAISRRLTAVTLDELELGRRAAELVDEIRRGERAIDDTEVFTLPLGWESGETL